MRPSIGLQRCSVLAALALTLGCADSTANRPPVDPVALQILPSSQWAGGWVQATSPIFRDTLPVVTAGLDTLDVSRVDSTTILVILPDTVSGAVTIDADAGVSSTGTGTVTTYGLHQARLVPGALGYEPLVVQSGSQPLFVAEGDYAVLAGSLSLLNPLTDAVVTRTGIRPVASSFGVLPSYQANRFVLRDSTGGLAVWQLLPTPSRVDTSLVQNNSSRHVTQLGDTIFFSTTSQTYTRTTPGGSTTVTSAYNDPLRLVYSPAGDKFTLVIASAPNGRAPVFTSNGDTAYTFAAATVKGAVFHPSGDPLFITTGPTGPGPDPDSLVIITAATGVRGVAVPLPAGLRSSALAFDPAADRLYIVADSAGTAELLVYDPVVLQLVGRIATPGFGSVNFWSAGIAIDPVGGRIHVAYPGSPIPVVTFDRLP